MENSHPLLSAGCEFWDPLRYYNPGGVTAFAQKLGTSPLSKDRLYVAYT